MRICDVCEMEMKENSTGWRELNYESELAHLGHPEGDTKTYLLCSWTCLGTLAASRPMGPIVHDRPRGGHRLPE